MQIRTAKKLKPLRYKHNVKAVLYRTSERHYCNQREKGQEKKTLAVTLSYGALNKALLYNRYMTHRRSSRV